MSETVYIVCHLGGVDYDPAEFCENICIFKTFESARKCADERATDVYLAKLQRAGMLYHEYGNDGIYIEQMGFDAFKSIRPRCVYKIDVGDDHEYDIFFVEEWEVEE